MYLFRAQLSIAGAAAALLLAVLPALGQAKRPVPPRRGAGRGYVATGRRTLAARPAVAKAAAGPAVLAPVRLVTIKGIVLGPDDLALPGASVFPLGRPGLTVITNASGEFTLVVPAAAVATLKLEVAYQGLGDWHLRMKAGDDTPLFITLLPQGE